MHSTLYKLICVLLYKCATQETMHSVIPLVTQKGKIKGVSVLQKAFAHTAKWHLQFFGGEILKTFY